MRKLLHRLGCSFHQVSGFLFKADVDKQQAFVQEYDQDKQTAPAQGWRRYFLDGVHPLYGLDVLSELWSVLYLQARRSPELVSAQAEFHARIVPAIAEQLMTETTCCGHTSARLPVNGTARRRP